MTQKYYATDVVNAYNYINENEKEKVTGIITGFIHSYGHKLVKITTLDGEGVVVRESDIIERKFPTAGVEWENGPNLSFKVDSDLSAGTQSEAPEVETEPEFPNYAKLVTAAPEKEGASEEYIDELNDRPEEFKAIQDVELEDPEDELKAKDVFKAMKKLKDIEDFAVEEKDEMEQKEKTNTTAQYIIDKVLEIIRKAE